MLSELFLVGLAFSILKGITLLVSYINNNAFPQPLNEKEEARYLEILSAGKNLDYEKGNVNLNQVEFARNMLVEHNLRLVAHLVKKFDGTGEDSDDLISIGTIGLIKGINTFNPNKGTKLATYAARCIENEILLTKEVRKDNPHLFFILGNGRGFDKRDFIFPLQFKNVCFTFS